MAGQEVEYELVPHLIGMSHHRFGTRKKGNGSGVTFTPLATNPSERSPFESRFAELILTTMDIYGFIRTTMDIHGWFYIRVWRCYSLTMI